MKRILCLVLSLLTLLLCAAGCGRLSPEASPSPAAPELPTWEEYEQMTDPEKAAFSAGMSEEDFDCWMQEAIRETAGVSEALPWEAEGSTAPAEYSWAEYEALTEEEREAFSASLTEEEFDIWMEAAIREAAGAEADAAPWTLPGGKAPDEYTWEEYLRLTEEHQMLFARQFADGGFDLWMQEATRAAAAEQTK